MILIYVVCKNKAEAKKIGFALVKKRLTGCCNIFPIETIYRLSDEIIEDRPRKNSSRIIRGKEVVLLIKTLKKNFKKIEKEVKKMHSYTAPCIIEIPTGKVNSEYLKWLNKEAK